MRHSVTLIREKCRGCTTCIRYCPTEAIRVRRGEAIIVEDRCIDCGQCIRVCPHRAKRAVCDSLERLSEFDYAVALPAPSLYGQFRNLENVNLILEALLHIGFHDIFEVARAAEMISHLTRRALKTPGALPRPVISSACPAVVRLICQRFPRLIGHIAPHIAPAELAAVLARREAVQKTGLPPGRVGVFFLTPCPAKATAVRSPVGLKAPVLDGAVSLSDVYVQLLPAMKKIHNPPDRDTAGLIGLGWPVSGGESAALLGESCLAADGIENIVRVLEDVENGKLPEVEFLELSACTQGCVGGCLTVENPFVAKSRIKRLAKFLPVSRGVAPPEGEELTAWDTVPAHTPVWQLDADVQTAMEKLGGIEALLSRLPGLDCASCGAPSCRSLAEDVMMGFASEEDCIFRLRDRMPALSGDGDPEQFLPPPFRHSGK